MGIEMALIHDHSSIVLDLVAEAGDGGGAFLPFHPTNNPPSRRWADTGESAGDNLYSTRIHPLFFFYFSFRPSRGSN